MVRKQFVVWRTGNAEKMNLDPLLAEFRAEVNDANAPAALDPHTSCGLDSK
jgi:hypothetical protein